MRRARPGSEKEQIFPAGSKAHQSIRMSQAGTNLPNEQHLGKVCIKWICGHAAQHTDKCKTTRFMVPMRVRFWRSRLPMNTLSLKGLKTSAADNTTPSPQTHGVKHRNKLGSPPTRPTQLNKKGKSPQREHPCGVTKQSYCRVSEPIFPTGTKAPKSLAATLHATATKRTLPGSWVQSSSVFAALRFP